MTLSFHSKTVLSVIIMSVLTLSAVFRIVSLSAAVPEKSLTVVMYHSVIKSDPSKYQVTENQLSDDIRALKAAGYTSVTLDEVLSYSLGENPDFPDKAVLITFDDGHLNNYTAALPILKAQGMTAVVAVVGSFTESAEDEKYRSPSYSYLNFREIKELQRSGTFQIACHSYGMHKITSDRCGIGKAVGETDEKYKERFTRDLEKWKTLMADNCGITTYCYVYPYGEVEKAADGILKENGYTVTLSCTEGINRIHVGSSLYRLKRYNRSGNITTADFLKKIAKNS